MRTSTTSGAFLLGICLLGGLALLGFQLAKAAIAFKQFERTVTVKGLAEREVAADIVIWPIQFTLANNDLEALYGELDNSTKAVRSFLVDAGIEPSAITLSPPSITDRSAQQYGAPTASPFRYTALQTVTVYTDAIAVARKTMAGLSALGRQGIVITRGNYEARTEYLYTGLNAVKPAMIEEATRNAREVAVKFAEDSESVLGKIRRASQGQFSINPRDKNNPHIKKIRVVSTVEYYLSD